MNKLFECTYFYINLVYFQLALSDFSRCLQMLSPAVWASVLWQFSSRNGRNVLSDTRMRWSSADWRVVFTFQRFWVAQQAQKRHRISEHRVFPPGNISFTAWISPFFKAVRRILTWSRSELWGSFGLKLETLPPVVPDDESLTTSSKPQDSLDNCG